MRLPVSTRYSDFAVFLQQEALPESYALQAEAYLLPFLDRLFDAVQSGAVTCFGVHGAQGSGKSTFAALIKWYLEAQRGLRVVQLSLDDFYLARDQRQVLAETVHPLFATRGVPGTHDVELAIHTIHSLVKLSSHESLAIPRFDKARDDRCPEAEWPIQSGPVDLIVFEGWCVGAPAQTAAELLPPVNALEANDDVDGRWRKAVNDALAGPYQQLFAHIDYLLMLKAPGFDCVAGWRLEQEQKLAARLLQRGQLGEASELMDADGIARFVQFYQRLTQHCLACLPSEADCVMTMADNRDITAVQYLREPTDD